MTFKTVIDILEYGKIVKLYHLVDLKAFGLTSCSFKPKQLTYKKN